MNVNVWDVTGEIGDLIRSKLPINPNLLADPAVPLTELASSDHEPGLEETS